MFLDVSSLESTKVEVVRKLNDCKGLLSRFPYAGGGASLDAERKLGLLCFIGSRDSLTANLVV